MALRKWQCPKASLYSTERSFKLVGLVVGCGRDNYFMACTVHEKIKVFEMSYTQLRCSRPCITTCFAHSGVVGPPSLTQRVCDLPESHDLEGGP